MVDSDNNKELPFVSALIVCRNEEEYIKISLRSILKQKYPDDKYEIIIIDGLSNDNTVVSAKQVVDEHREATGSVPQISFFENPKKILAAGWNIGIKESVGRYVFRIDAHSEVASDYIIKCVKTMEAHDAVCVGGKIESKSLQGDDDTITKVLSSPFGVGNSSFRVSNVEGYSDTAVYGLYDKEIFGKIGYFDESLVRNQDIELHARIKHIGGEFYFNPQIKSVYFTRNSTKKMLKQAFQNGKWNPIVKRKNKSALSIRHMIPFAFVLFTGITTALGFLNKIFWYLVSAVMALHLCLGICFAKKKTADPHEIAKMPLMFMALHMSYGIGYFTGLFYHSKEGEE